jgi:hypothetical protein
MPEPYELLNAAAERIRAATAKRVLPDDQLLGDVEKWFCIVVRETDYEVQDLISSRDDVAFVSGGSVIIVSPSGNQRTSKQSNNSKAACAAQDAIRDFLHLAQDKFPTMRVNVDQIMKFLGRGVPTGRWTWDNLRRAINVRRPPQTAEALTVKEAANAMGDVESTNTPRCVAGKIEGARMVRGEWRIPASSIHSSRTATGRTIKPRLASAATWVCSHCQSFETNSKTKPTRCPKCARDTVFMRR